MRCTKATIKQITIIADKLPERFYISHQNTLISGRDIFLSGLDSNGIKPDDTKHMIDMPVYGLVNHKRRMISTFNANGFKGVNKYVNNVLDLN